MINGRALFPPMTPLSAVRVRSSSTHWYAGSYYNGNPTNASEIVARIATPASEPLSDEFYYVLASVWDDSGSYDQIGFSDAYGIWGLSYSWTSGPCSDPTYNYDPMAINLNLSTDYTFYIMASSSYGGGRGGTWFEAWTGSTEVWSLFAPNDAKMLNIAHSYCGAYDYTDYEEVYHTHIAGGLPSFNFYSSENEWIGANSVAATWAGFSAATPPNSVPSAVTIYINGEVVDISNDGNSLAAGAITPPAPTILRGQSVALTANPFGGNPPYSFQWYASSDCSTSPVPGETSSDFSASPTSTTRYYYSVSDSSSPPLSACSPGDTINVNPTFTAGTIIPDSPTIGVAEPVQLNANPSGGISPYNVTWYTAPGPGICSTSDVMVSMGPVFTPSPLMSTYYCYIATDSESPPVSSASIADLVTVSTLPRSFPTLTCTHASVMVGSTVNCKATVKGSGSAPTGNVAWSSDSSGTFLIPSCKLSSHGSYSTCSVKFTPASAGSPVTLSANYGGDSKNSPSGGTYTLAVTMKTTKLAVSCTPGSSPAGSTTGVTCSAKATGYSPTGIVSWSQSGTGAVHFDSTSCTISRGACAVTMFGSQVGTVTVIASYQGDSNNQGSSRAATLTIKRASTITTLSCTRSSLGVGTSITCTGTVSGGDISHNGTIMWSKISGTGRIAFFSATCTLSSGSCTVTVTATVVGNVDIKATYGGDSDSIGSSGTIVLEVS